MNYTRLGRNANWLSIGLLLGVLFVFAWDAFAAQPKYEQKTFKIKTGEVATCRFYEKGPLVRFCFILLTERR